MSTVLRKKSPLNFLKHRAKGKWPKLQKYDKADLTFI